jgi:hypothetical protein
MHLLLLLLLSPGPLQGKAVAIVKNEGPGCQVSTATAAAGYMLPLSHKKP